MFNTFKQIQYYMSFLRSKKMKYCNLVIPIESAYVVMNELARLGQFHFLDYDPQLSMINRPFANYVKRYDSIQKLNFFELLLEEFKKNLHYCENVQTLLDYLQQVQYRRMNQGHAQFAEFQQEIEFQKYKFKSNLLICKIYGKVNIITEQQLVLQKAQDILGQSAFSQYFYDFNSIQLQQIKKKKFDSLCYLLLQFQKSANFMQSLNYEETFKFRQKIINFQLFIKSKQYLFITQQNIIQREKNFSFELRCKIFAQIYQEELVILLPIFVFGHYLQHMDNQQKYSIICVCLEIRNRRNLRWVVKRILLSFLTFGVLMTLDEMEYFLHALRLHWVEFQNKFQDICLLAILTKKF
ncbi:unnamed protein product [Paramecium sonneborni]|uniref:V-type proton ATPase subunit a n=1 Tax=Paramecium sonneborni TaxID=65129 RepID=A0A8S1MX54_9CILI|nr:unnamed protein product [Paramecium sonneborni]